MPHLRLGPDRTYSAAPVERRRIFYSLVIRKPFVEFAAEVAAGLCAGRGDHPIAETARLGVVEVAPGDWRLSTVFDHAIEVVCDESFS